jgi:hypothetical protein
MPPDRPFVKQRLALRAPLQVAIAAGHDAVHQVLAALQRGLLLGQGGAGEGREQGTKGKGRQKRLHGRLQGRVESGDRDTN